MRLAVSMGHGLMGGLSPFARIAPLLFEKAKVMRLAVSMGQMLSPGSVPIVFITLNSSWICVRIQCMAKDKSKIHLIFISVFAAIQVVLIILTSVCFIKLRQMVSSSEIFRLDNKGEKYTLYIGTNDKDTYIREIPIEECRRRIDSICMKYVEGFSIGDMKGKWVDESGTLTEEDTLVYIFYDTTDEAIKKIMDEVLVELNQNSILLEKEHVTSAFYNGK